MCWALWIICVLHVFIYPIRCHFFVYQYLLQSEFMCVFLLSEFSNEFQPTADNNKMFIFPWQCHKCQMKWVWVVFEKIIDDNTFGMFSFKLLRILNNQWQWWWQIFQLFIIYNVYEHRPFQHCVYRLLNFILKRRTNTRAHAITLTIVPSGPYFVYCSWSTKKMTFLRYDLIL